MVSRRVTGIFIQLAMGNVSQTESVVTVTTEAFEP
jgi:hypothetical protein